MTIYKSTTPEVKIKRKDGSVAKVKINSPWAAAEFFRSIFDKEMFDFQEQMMVVFLNNANNTIGWVKLSSGGLTGCMVDFRLIFKFAFSCDTLPAAMMLCHNHPSGNNHDQKIIRGL
jgi:DNA repair protein RadC